MEPTAPPPTPDEAGAEPGARQRPWPAIVLGVLAALLAVVVIVLLVRDDDSDVATDETTTTVEDTTTTTEEEATTTTEAETTTTEATADTIRPGGITREEAINVVWPDPASDTTFDEPGAAVESFAEDLLGFVDPVYSEFMQGDSRSGEMEVRATGDGPATTIGVRQLSDDTWYVLFAATSEVELTTPAAQATVDHPMDVEGTARGFEGQVRVAVYVRGDTEPLAEDFFTAGSGEELESFTGTLDWPIRGEGGWGVVVASTASGADGSTWAATAIPVGFIGGD
jgi:hypothetical protein